MEEWNCQDGKESTHKLHVEGVVIHPLYSEHVGGGDHTERGLPATLTVRQRLGGQDEIATTEVLGTFSPALRTLHKESGIGMRVFVMKVWRHVEMCSPFSVRKVFHTYVLAGCGICHCCQILEPENGNINNHWNEGMET